MVSRPAFNPNIFSKRITPAQWRDLQSKDHPFVNRALGAFRQPVRSKSLQLPLALNQANFLPTPFSKPTLA